MKKLSAIIAALALVFGFTQCKKNVETVTTTSGNGGVHITVNASYATKHDVITTQGGNYGEVHFANGDKLLVGNGDKYVGTLIYDGVQFSGTIGAEVGLTTTDKLHFYYTGGLEPIVTVDDEGMTFKVYEISDQSDNLPVFSYGCTSSNYDTEVDTYSCFLYNKCALVKFNLPENTTGDVKVYGMCSVVVFTFTKDVLDNVFEPTGDRSSITLNKRGENEGWAILLPQDEVEGATVMVNGNLYSDAVDVPTIQNNDLIDNLTISASTPYTPVFSVGPNEAVHFSPGNLQYQASTKTWRFAEHQWDYVGGNSSGSEPTHYGTVSGSSNNDAASDYEGWIDLFMWGTSGWKYFDDNLCTLFKPWNHRDGTNNGMNSVNTYGVGPSLGSDVGSDLNGTNYDWGVYNAILNPTTNSNDPAGTWRTLTYEETKYMLEERANATTLMGYGIVNDVKGLILLPDGYPVPDGLTFISDIHDENEYDTDEWSLMEANGAVFFPCGGSYNDLTEGVGSNKEGFYWTATHYGHGSGNSKDEFGPSAKAYSCEFDFNDDVRIEQGYRYEHFSVRLVKNVQ